MNKHEKREVKWFIYQSKREVNEQIRKMNQNVSKLFRMEWVKLMVERCKIEI